LIQFIKSFTKIVLDEKIYPRDLIGTFVKLTKTLGVPFRNNEPVGEIDVLLTDKIIPIAVMEEVIPDYVPAGELFYFPLRITVENCGATTLTDIIVRDIFAVQVIPFDPEPSQGTVVITPQQNSQKYDLLWNIGTLSPPNIFTLDLKVGTEFNPGGNLAPTDENESIFYNGDEGQPSARVLMVIGESEVLLVSVPSMEIDIEPDPDDCMGSDGGWNDLPWNKCSKITTSLPVEETASFLPWP